MKASTTGYRRQASDILKKHSPKRQHILETWIDDVTDGENDKAEGTLQDQKVARHACMLYSMFSSSFTERRSTRFSTYIGDNTTAFRRKLTLFSAIPLSRFSLQMPRFFAYFEFGKMRSIDTLCSASSGTQTTRQPASSA